MEWIYQVIGGYYEWCDIFGIKFVMFKGLIRVIKYLIKWSIIDLFDEEIDKLSRESNWLKHKSQTCWSS